MHGSRFVQNTSLAPLTDVLQSLGQTLSRRSAQTLSLRPPGTRLLAFATLRKHDRVPCSPHRNCPSCLCTRPLLFSRISEILLPLPLPVYPAIHLRFRPSTCLRRCLCFGNPSPADPSVLSPFVPSAVVHRPCRLL